MEINSDEYQSIKEPAEGLYKEKGSKFIARAYPIQDENEIKAILADLRKTFHDARHHCYAYRLGLNGEQYRANDDGEPSGSAGNPIFGQLRSFNLTNTLVVVVRYFGGTKLGVSGLINAYKSAARDALLQSEIVKHWQMTCFWLDFAYTDLNLVMRMLKEEEAQILHQEFTDRCRIQVNIRQSRASSLSGRINQIMTIAITGCG